MKEVEILIEVKSPKEEAIKALSVFESRGVKQVNDIYFFDPLRDTLRPEKDGRLRASFRLRTKEGKAFITYKKDYFGDNDEWLYSDEHEVGVENADTAEHIFESLGFEELIRVENEKHTFLTSDYEIVFEDVKGLGLYLEVEKIMEVTDAQVAMTKDEIRAFLLGLNIKLGQEMNAGKPELMLARRSGDK